MTHTSHQGGIVPIKHPRRFLRIVPLLAICMTLILPLAAQQSFTASSNHAPLLIPDNDADFAIESSIGVPVDVIISDVNVTLDIEHTSAGDLEIDLFSPDGKRVRLVDEVCEEQDHFLGTKLDDQASQEIGAICPAGTGTFRPADSLSEFNGRSSFGVWTLVVNDDDDGSTGILNGWSLTINGDFATIPIFSSQSVVSGASFQGGAVAVGEIASIFGNALGPAVGVQGQINSSTGMLPTELAGVQVFFDEIAAPLFYVSSTQINAQVPFEVAARPDVTVRVEYEDTGTSQVNIPLLEAGPAIFTLNGRGQGHAAAINPNGSVNDSNNPVAPGQVISIYATGLGAVAPEIETGMLTPEGEDELREVVADVTATVGGEDAEVLFAGLAPNFVGLYQVNIRVPESVTPGLIVPIELTIGERSVENLTWITVE